MRGRNRFTRNALAAAGLLAILSISGCSASPTPSADAQPSAAFATPAPQAAANSVQLATSTTSDWTPVSSLSDQSDDSDVKTLYDASAFQFDFWLGLWPTRINSQRVFVRAPDAA